MFFLSLVLFAIVVSLVSAATHMARRRRMARRNPRGLVVSTRAGLALGAMFLGFQQIVQPQVRHMIAEQEKEDQDDDAKGEDEPPGGRLFHQQLRKIRHGEEIDGLAVSVETSGPFASRPRVGR